MKFRAALIAIALASAGCYAEVPPPGVSVEAGYGYEPLYYDGNIVYYDTLGSPYYVYGGVPYYVPHTYPYYNHYVTHYRRFRPGYHAWYAHHRPAFRGYHAMRPRVIHRR